MSVAIIRTERRLPYPPDALAGLVADVESYPRFIPWVKTLTLKRERGDARAWEGVAEALVGWKAFLERFATRVRADVDAGSVDVALVRGPFKTLKNEWRFAPDGAGGAIVRFTIAYEFKNPILQMAAGLNREHVADRIMRAFETEAARRFASQLTSAGE
ncbi:MAG: type II toxin-antitoxin system RatA family toxin [Alphaproteobacteria bacterium]|nr:type II toxin-antitoxin system RatA family toxin [Alphaproteobacteria bacterium]